MKRTSLAVALALWLALIAPQATRAAGGPVPPVQGSYIGAPGSPYRYAAFAAGGGTVVKVREAGAGPGVPGLRLAGHYGIPGVVYGGSLTGLSADGRTLILAALTGNSPPRTTRLFVLDTAPLAIRAKLTLRGWSTVDAISPDGRWLYLIHYPSADVSKYEVLAYDLPAHRLLPKPVVDPRDRDEPMVGFAISRVMSVGGRWAYTLYLRPSGEPFIHALDTKGRRAVCVDLPALTNMDLGNAHLGLGPGGGPGGTMLRVEAAGVTWARIDTRTFRVSAGGPPSTAAPVAPAVHKRTRAAGPGQSDGPWAVIVLAIAALGLLAAAGARMVRSGRHPDYARGPDGAPIIHVDARHTDRDRADEELPVA